MSTPKTRDAAVRKRNVTGPRLIAKLHKEILAHPDYNTKLSTSTRFAFENGCVHKGSACDKENNKWSRIIWAHLYENGPVP
jgi:hypothetical protein